MADYDPENLRRLPFESANVQSDSRTLPIGSNEGSLGATPAAGKSAADAYAERMAGLPGTLRGAAYGFFSGLAGQDPMAAVRGALETQQGQQRLGLQGRQVAVEEQGLTLREKALAETVKQHMQTTQLGVGTLAHNFLKDIASAPKSLRGPMAETAKKFLGPLMESLGMPIPDTALDAMMSAPETADAYAGLISGWFGKDIEKIKQLNAAIGNMPKDDPNKVKDFLKSVFDQEVVIAGSGVMQVAEKYMNHIWKQGAATQQRLGLIDSTGKRLPLNLSLGNFADAFKAITGNDPTPAEQVAMRDLLNDPKNAGFWVKIGVTPGKIAEEQASVVAKAEAELGTRKGAADLASTEAATRKAGYMAVPGQGGSIIQLPGAGGGGAPAAGGTAQAQAGGLATAPGVNVLATSPGPGMSPEASKSITTMEQSLAKLEQLTALVKTGSVDKYLGPAKSRPFSAVMEWSKKNLPSAIAGNIPSDLSDLEQAAAIVKNIQIYTRTGAAVRETEEPRILSEIPSKENDKPEAFKRKLVQSLANAKVLVRRYTELVGPDGRLKAGADPDAVAKKFPLPKSLTQPNKSPRDMTDAELRDAYQRARGR